MIKYKRLLFFALCLPHILFAIEKPKFSHTRDFYVSPFHLELTSDDVNGTIHYTLDGSKPGPAKGVLYQNPLFIDKTVAVRAIALQNESASEVRTHTYIFLDDIIKQDNSGVPRPQHAQDHVYWTEEFDMTDVTQSEEQVKAAFKDIPTLSIVSAYDSLFGIAGILRGQNLREGSGGQAGDPNDPNWHEMVECSIEMIYPENEKFGQYKDWQENAGIKVQGGGGRWNNGYYDHKQSFTLKFKKQYGAGTLKNDIFIAAPFNRSSSPGRFDKIILRAGHNKSWGANTDRANTVYTRDQFGRDLQLLMSGWGSHGTFVHLYLNGKYWGLYNPCERMDDNTMSIYLGGEDDDYYFGKGKGGHQSGNSDRYDYLRSTDWTDRQLSDLADYLAIDEYIDTCILYAYANPGDGPQYYFGNRNSPPGPMYYTAWDIEDSFQGGSVRTGPPISTNYNRFNVYSKISHNIDFEMKLADRVYEHCFNDGLLTDNNVSAIWDSLCGFIENAIICEIARWGDERGELYDPTHWYQEWQDVRNDLQGRASKLIQALKKVGTNYVGGYHTKKYPSVMPPVFKNENHLISDKSIDTSHGFELTIQRLTSSDTIYYTIDGSDPRVWDLSGKVSPFAHKINSHSQTIIINHPTVVKARCKKGNEWSPLHELTVIQEFQSNVANGNLINCAKPKFLLFQNYPNPFNPFTVIYYQLPGSGHVSLRVYDILGREVEVLVDETQLSGSYQYQFEGKRLTSGIYFAHLKTPTTSQSIQMILTK